MGAAMCMSCTTHKVTTVKELKHPSVPLDEIQTEISSVTHTLTHTLSVVFQYSHVTLLDLCAQMLLLNHKEIHKDI